MFLAVGLAVRFEANAGEAADGASSATGVAEPTAIEWIAGWSPEVAERARREHRLVLLDLEAVWCHWCHVMDETTYRDAAVIALVRDHYLAVRVDQDSDPQLANRYQDYGWPATVLFKDDLTELAKRRGYLPPAAFASMLQAFVDDPSPGPSVVQSAGVVPAPVGALSPQQRANLEANSFLEAYDPRNGGWGTVHKLVDGDSLGYAIALARAGDARAARMARRTLDAALELADPVWGGFYQYSDAVDWKSPHFEKIASIQAQALSSYALAWAVWKRPAYVEAARGVVRYLARFWTSPEGAFYASQDADLSEKIDGHAYFRRGDGARLALGIPRIDPSVYARENGWLIAALAGFHDWTGDREALDRATRAASWIAANRGAEGGGFRHRANDPSAALGDTVAMGRAFLALYASTAERVWLSRAVDCARAVDSQFRDSSGAGFDVAPADASVVAVGVFRDLVRDLDENLAVARFGNLLSRYTGDPAWRALSERAMRYLASDAIASSGGPFLTGVLLADRELASEPLHVTIVGAKSDPRARALFSAARSYAADYRRVEWWDPSEGPPPSADVSYPELDSAAAFPCSGQSCGAPVRDPAKLAAALDRVSAPGS